jgi:hypothetical protein
MDESFESAIVKQLDLAGLGKMCTMSSYFYVYDVIGHDR